jgi:hypothetical protein
MKKMQKATSAVTDITKKLESSVKIDSSVFQNVGASAFDKQSNENVAINDFVNSDEGEPNDPSGGAEKIDVVDPKTKKASKTSVFPMIFKVIPIGLNIFKKFPKVMSGLKDVTIAIEKLIVNTVLTVSDVVPSGLAYIMMTFVMGMYHLMCVVMNIKNLHICSIPYICDLIVWLFITSICSFVNILDTLFIKSLVGFPLYDLVRYAFERIGSMIHYPDFIINLCYKCKLIQNNQVYDIVSDTSTQTRNHIGKVLIKDVPKRIIDPGKQGILGISKMTSIFNI